MESPATSRLPPATGAAADLADRVVASLASVIHAPAETLRMPLLCLLAEGHVLIEDVPGVGKTVLAKALARALELDFSRLQFTPDLLPSDVTGVNVYEQHTGAFRFRPGPVFANVLLVDEVNRASPKTQSALLEAMQESQVTVDGETYPLVRPFLVFATQNPVEYEGTYPLPEAQLDRFAVRMEIGYPPLLEEARMLAEQTGDAPLDALRAGRNPLRAPGRDRRRALGLRRGERQPLRRRGAPAHAFELAPGPRREPSLGHRAATAGKGPGARRAPGLRHTGRRPGAGRAGACTQAHPRSDCALVRSRCRRHRSGGADGHTGSRVSAGGAPGSRSIVALGLGALAVSWLFGAVAVAVVGVGLVLAGILARLWARYASGGVAVERSLPAGEIVEGDDLVLELRARRLSRLPLGAVSVRQPAGRLGTPELRLRHSEGVVVLPRAPRGRYVLERLLVSIEDPLGLERVSYATGDRREVLVRPRVPELDVLFSDAGARGTGGARALLRRPSGFELHAVREYQDGEPLRAVHWPSTARRARLMVKELDDAPRDDVVVVLDADPAGVTGEPGSSSFDAAVRAAGAIVRAHAARGRRAALVLTGVDADVVRIRSLDREWPLVLDALSSIEPRPGPPLAVALTDPGTPAARALELVVVTSFAEHAADALATLRHDGRRAALVLVDGPSFVGVVAGRPPASALRAVAAGVPVAVVQAGHDLRRALEGALAGRASA